MKRNIRIWAMCIVAVGLVASACAPTQPAAPTPAQPVAPTPAPAAPQVSTPTPRPTVATPTPASVASAPTPKPAGPKYGGELHLMKIVEAPHYDPNLNASALPWSFAFQQLIRYDPQTGKPLPELAESWEYKDPTTLVFNIRKGVHFHNKPPVNGREATADDVVFTVKRIMDPKLTSPWRGNFRLVKSITAMDKYTVQIVLTEPSASFIQGVAHTNHYFMAIVPHEVVDMYGDFKDGQHLIGTGPYMVEKATLGVGMSFVKNPDYYVKGKPYMDSIHMDVIGDLATALAAYRTGRLDYGVSGMGDLTADTARELAKTNPAITLNPITRDWVNMLEMNLQDKPFNDVRVRRAIHLAIDRDEVLQINAGGEDGGYVSGPLSWKEFPDYGISLDELRKMPGYRKDKTDDLKEAKRLLAEAGYPNGLTVDGYVTEFLPVVNKTNLEVAKAQLQKIGVTINIKVIPTAQFLKFDSEGVPTIRGRGYLAAPDAGDQLYTRHYSKGARNGQKYNNAKLDKILDEQAVTLDVAKRKQLIRQAQDMLLEDVPQIWLHGYYSIYPQQPWVKGVKPGPFSHWGYAEDWWLDK